MTRYLVQHTTSGEHYIIEEDEHDIIRSVSGPYHYGDLQQVGAHQLDDEDWAATQDWRVIETIK